MTRFMLDGHALKTEADVHDHFAVGLNFPAYYGRNLDALYDCLTDVDDRVAIEWTDFAESKRQLGDYAERLRVTLQHATEANPHLSLVIPQVFPTQSCER